MQNSKLPNLGPLTSVIPLLSLDTQLFNNSSHDIPSTSFHFHALLSKYIISYCVLP